MVGNLRAREAPSKRGAGAIRCFLFLATGRSDTAVTLHINKKILAELDKLISVMISWLL